MSRLATIIICLILSIILGFFLVWPQYQKFTEERWHLKEKETERSNQEEYFTHVENVAKELSGYENEKSKINSAFPYGPDIADILNFLDKATSGNGLSIVKITSFSVDKEKSGSKSSQEKEENVVSRAKEINIEFDVKGSYPAFKNFILTLEKSARVIEVESVVLKKKMVQTEKEEPPVFTLKIKTYYY